MCDQSLSDPTNAKIDLTTTDKADRMIRSTLPNKTKYISVSWPLISTALDIMQMLGKGRGICLLWFWPACGQLLAVYRVP